MNCEICHKAPAETAIGTDGDGEELYVCKACAEAELNRRRKRRERTRKAQEAAASGSSQDGEVPHPLDAFLDAVSGLVDDIEKVVRQHEESAQQNAEKVYKPVVGVKVAAPYLLRGRLHLEGLHLTGELEAVRRGVEVLDLRLEGISVDGVNDVGHIYHLCHCNDFERARRVLNQLVEQERNARIRLFEETPRIFGDALCRALAILKNCRLLSQGEYFDLLSPLRLAAMENMLDGIKIREIERMMKSLQLEYPEPPPFSIEEHEASDADRADEVNRRFEDVVIND